MTTNDEQYTPTDERTVKDICGEDRLITMAEQVSLWAGRKARDIFEAWQKDHDAQVKRDAAREALDGFAEAQEGHSLSLNTRRAYVVASRCTHAALAARDYREINYPAETS